MKELEAAAPFHLGFPYTNFGTDPGYGDGQPNMFVNSAGVVKWVKSTAPIKPGPLNG